MCPYSWLVVIDISCIIQVITEVDINTHTIYIMCVYVYIYIYTHMQLIIHIEMWQ